MDTLRLDPEKLIATADILARRIDERFPGSGLHRVCLMLVDQARGAEASCAAVRRPSVPLRLLSGLVIVLIVGAAVGAIVVSLGGESGGAPVGLADVIQISEALINDLILLGAAIWFFVMLERRAKRGRVMRSVRELRTLAHLIDVHQLTKSPEALGSESTDTPNSPKRVLAPWQLGRYLDYCSEMLSLTAKVGVLFCDAFEDTQAQEAVTDLEELSIGLQRKIWQKLVTLESRAARLRLPAPAGD